MRQEFVTTFMNSLNRSPFPDTKRFAGSSLLDGTFVIYDIRDGSATEGDRLLQSFQLRLLRYYRHKKIRSGEIPAEQLITVHPDLKLKEFFLAKHLLDRPVDLEEGGPGVPVSVEGRQIALYEFEGSVYAVDNRCPHRGGPMADGPVSGPTITCPLHSWSFDMRSGEAVGRPGATIACFSVSKDPSGKIAIEID